MSREKTRQEATESDKSRVAFWVACARSPINRKGPRHPKVHGPCSMRGAGDGDRTHDIQLGKLMPRDTRASQRGVCGTDRSEVTSFPTSSVQESAVALARALLAHAKTARNPGPLIEAADALLAEMDQGDSAPAAG